MKDIQKYDGAASHHVKRRVAVVCWIKNQFKKKMNGSFIVHFCIDKFSFNNNNN